MLLIPELERIIKWKETTLRHSLILRFLEPGKPFLTEVEVRTVADCFAFGDFRLNPNI